MTFFTQALNDGTIDDRISHKELEMAMIGMLTESAAWEQHKARHKDAVPVKIDVDDGISDAEKRIDHKKQEVEYFNYDSLTKHFVAGCQCGQKFEIDLKNDSVSPLNTGLKMKEIDPYNKNSNSEYGSNSQDGSNPSYNSRTQRQSVGYNSQNGMNYKN